MFIVNDQLTKKQEDKGRDIFLQLHPGMNWTESIAKFDVWDLKGSSSTTKMYVEIKNRWIKSTSYPTAFLEVKKYNNLRGIQDSLTERTKVFYFTSYTDSVSYLFDLTSMRLEDYPIYKKWMKEVTLDNQEIMVEKEVYELPLASSAKKYKY